MSNIDNFVLEKEVARLDGFLLAASFGSDFSAKRSAYAYLIKLDSNKSSIIEYLKDYYKWIPNLELRELQRLNGGMRSVEEQIRNNLGGEFNSSYSEAFKRKFSFRAMEILHCAIAEDYKNVIDVFFTSNIANENESNCIYFFLLLKCFILVIQFNDDGAVGHGLESSSYNL
jgi:hypothetical protein